MIVETQYLAKRFRRFDAVEDLSIQVPWKNASDYLIQSNQAEVREAIERFAAGLDP